MPRALDLVGCRFTHLVAIELTVRGGLRAWRCKCDCGGEVIALAGKLRIGRVASCGCKTGRPPNQELTHSRLKEVLDYNTETGEFTWRRDLPWVNGGSTAGCKCKQTGRITICIDHQHYLAHILAWFYVHGEWPSTEIDHRNMDQSNNKIRNIRPAGKSNNGANRCAPANNTSGFKGVYYQAGAWVSRIGVRGQLYYIGRFKTASAAAKAYDEAAVKGFGEFSRLNFPRDSHA